MFSKVRKHNTRPIVKKVSALVDKRSHKQRKYLSLMLVPSYSSGKTRSLKIPRVVFYCILAVIGAVTTVTAGFYMRSERYAQQYQDTREYLHDTVYFFESLQQEAEEELARFADEHATMYEQLSEEQRMARIQQDVMRNQQQGALNELQQQIDELERMIREFDDHMQAVIEGLSSRLFIPSVLAHYETMMNSRATLLSQSVLFNPPDDIVYYAPVSVGFLRFAEGQYAPLPELPTEDTLHDRIAILTDELELQMLLFEDLLSYRQIMDPHLRNFPTLWPITAEISSGFGRRQNPMGGRGTEFHQGIDLRAPTGTPIRAAGGGTVIFSGWQGGYGQVVIIDHGLGGFSTLYAHNSVNLVYVGQRVERGDIIARVGTTGRTTGAHLHFEVRINGRHQNPRNYMLEHWR